jgi:hypothetical protein
MVFMPGECHLSTEHGHRYPRVRTQSLGRRVPGMPDELRQVHRPPEKIGVLVPSPP